MVLPHGLLAATLVGACLANEKLNTEGPHGPPYVLVGDIQVPVEDFHRQSDPLGASPNLGKARLWPEGKVRYAIATDYTNAAAPAPYLSNDDARISWAVAHLEEKTCIRMSKCASPATCEEPFIVFISHASECSSPVGYSGYISSIYLASGCTRGIVVHEIYHSLGVKHEQVRFDRDEFVTVRENNVAPAFRHNFAKMDASDRDLGKYDYGSLMHYGNYDFSTNGEQAIISPQPIGQRSGLSAGDIATLDFMYNGCSAVFAAPVCMTNKDELEANEVDPYQEYLCQFNVEWTAGQSVYVDYSLTTTPESSTTFPPGTVMDDSSSRRVLFQPSFLDMDKVYTVAATFTAATNASISTTCSTTVKIVPAPTNVDVKTGHMSNAGTNGKVAIVLYGAGGGDALLDSPGTGDITTVVVLSKAPPETIQSASISLLNGNDWYAEYLMIGDRIAVFDRWLVSDSLQFFAGFTKSKRYSATVKTGTLSGAGTDSNIWLTVVGSQGETRAVLLNPRLSGNAFENGDTDVISFDGRDVGTISSLKVKSDGMYAAPAWYLDYIEVNSVRACFLRWIEEGTYTQAVAGSCVLKTYDVVVKTGTLSGAGTDSNIRLTIIGDKSTTNAVELNQLLSGNVFENGDTDRLTFSNRDVGNIVSLTVESDGLYAGSDWDLDSIQVNNDLVCFRRWIEEGTYTQAVLGSCDWKTYDVVVKTGTRSGAGTDSNIWLTIIGDRSTTNAVKLNPLLSGDAFENGDTDRLTFSNRDVGNIVSLQVRSDGKYAGSDWDLSYITVNSKRATFNTWIEEGTYTRTVS